MSDYGRAEAVARAAEAAEADRLARVRDDPALRSVLAERDVGGLFRAIKATGVSYRRIAELVGMSQSEVSDILNGRRVLSYDVLVRIAEGLSVPRARMGLAYDEMVGARASTAATVEVDEPMRRRTFVTGAAGVVLSTWGAGYAVDRVPFATDVPPVPSPLPSQIDMADVSVFEQTIHPPRSARPRGGWDGGARGIGGDGCHG